MIQKMYQIEKKGGWDTDELSQYFKHTFTYTPNLYHKIMKYSLKNLKYGVKYAHTLWKVPIKKNTL